MFYVHTTSEPPVYECTYCSGERTPHSSVKGSYCSLACYYRQKGQKALARIQSHHAWCATCFKPVKEIEPPTEYVLQAVECDDALVGYQYQTEHTDRGVDEADLDQWRRLVFTRWSCECGTIDPGDRHEWLSEIDTAETIASLYTCLQDLEATGALDHRPDKTLLFEALREEWTDWEYAIGKCLYG